MPVAFPLPVNIIIENTFKTKSFLQTSNDNKNSKKKNKSPQEIINLHISQQSTLYVRIISTNQEKKIIPFK